MATADELRAELVYVELAIKVEGNAYDHITQRLLSLWHERDRLLRDIADVAAIGDTPSERAL